MKKVDGIVFPFRVACAGGPTTLDVASVGRRDVNFSAVSSVAEGVWSELQARDVVFWEQLFEAVADGVLVVSLGEGRLLEASVGAERLTGFAVEQLRGAHVELLAPPEGFEEEDRSTSFGLEVCWREGTHEEVRIGRADGFPVIASIRVAHHERGGERVAICVLRDETERRMLERELITKHVALLSAHRELDQKVEELRRMGETLAERNDEVAKMGARLARVSRRAMLAEVIAEVAHSINNPLAALASSLRMLRRFEEQVRDPKRFRQLLDRCFKASERMTRSVEELRIACRSGQLAPSDTLVAVAPQVDAALAMLSHRLEKGVDVIVDVPDDLGMAVAADELHHAVLNLVDNALYAVGGQGRIEVRASLLDDGYARLCVADSGEGIGGDALERIFDPFFTTKPAGVGTGLGLSMVRRMARRHGGRVEVEARGYLGGACFHVYVPGGRVSGG